MHFRKKRWRNFDAGTDGLRLNMELIWSEASATVELEGLINAPPFLDAPFNVTVVKMTRECQI